MGVSVRDQLLGAMYWPLTQEGSVTIDAFFEVPGVSSWSPTRIFYPEIQWAFRIGYPFKALRRFESSARHFRQMGKALAFGRTIAPSLMSELEAGVLLAELGATPCFLKAPTTMPDLEAKWSSGCILDVEVTRADRRLLHKRAQDALADLSMTVTASDFSWDLICYVADATNQVEMYEVLAAASHLAPSGVQEVVGRWSVRAIPLDQREAITNNPLAFRPSWWPDNAPSFDTSSTVIGGAQSPLVQIHCLVPATSYMNPVVKKADGGQRRGGHPFLIAMDSTELPRVHERAPVQLTEHFPGWDHVSGVLFFQSIFWTDLRREVTWSLYRNPYAKLALPPELARFADGEKRSSIVNFADHAAGQP